MTDRPVIAVVDDDAITREVLTDALRAEYEVQAFGDGRAVLEYLAAYRVCLLLLDVEMPGLTGYETCRALRTMPDRGDVPVIFLSARVLPEERLEGYAAGGDDYVTKPFHVDEVQAKVRLAIEAHRRARALAQEAQSMGETALVTAEMMGEVGVVLDFQRAIAGCTTPEAMADAAFDALGRFRLDGCMRLRLRGRGDVVTRSTSGVVSALETSLLDHLAARDDARIVTMGPSLGFGFGDVTLLARSLDWALSPTTPQTLDAIGRARDNVALIVEGVLSRLRALQAESDARRLRGAQHLIDATREALRTLDQNAHAIDADLDAAFEATREEFEYLFPQLGLTPEQEQRLADIVERQRRRGLAIVARGRLAGQGLRQVLEQMEQASAPA